MNLRSLLNQETRRQIKLIETLYFSSNGLTAAQIKKITGCSLAVLQQDVIHINRHYPPFEIVVEEKLYRMHLENRYGLDLLYQQVMEQSMECYLLELLFFEEYASITDIASQLFTSVSSVYRAITKIERLLQPLNISIAKRPLRIIGNEAIVRHFFVTFFREKKYPFSRLAQRSSLETEIRELINEFMIENQFYEAYLTSLRVEYNFYISLIRLKNGHCFEAADLTSPAVITPDLADSHATIADIEAVFGLSFGLPAYRECFWLFYGDFLILNVRQQEKALQSNQLLADIHELVAAYLNFLEDKLQFSFADEASRYDNLKLTITMFLSSEVYLYQNSGDYISIISQNRKTFIQEFAKLYAYQIDVLKQLFLEFIGDTIEEKATLEQLLAEDQQINHLYLLIVHFPGIVEKISRSDKKINVLILSTIYPMQESFLVDILSRNLHGSISYHFANHMSEFLKSEQMAHIDLILSTASIDERFQNIPVFIVEPFPTKSTFNALQLKINEILAKKHQITL